MEWFDWTQLGSFSGATFAVVLLTQLTKEIPGIRRMPTQLWSYLVAAAVLLLAQIFGPGFAPDAAVLALINAALVSLAANGGYAALDRLKQGLTGEGV